MKIGSGVLNTEQDPAETRQTLRLVEATLFGLVRKDQPMSLYWHPDMVWNSPSGVGTAQSLKEFLDKVHEVFLNGLTGTWDGSHNARYAEGRFAVSTGWPSLVAVHDGEFLSIPASGNTLRWRIMDFWERGDDLLITNWVHIDMINIFKQMGVDVFEIYGRYRQDNGRQASQAPKRRSLELSPSRRPRPSKPPGGRNPSGSRAGNEALPDAAWQSAPGRNSAREVSS